MAETKDDKEEKDHKEKHTGSSNSISTSGSHSSPFFSSSRSSSNTAPTENTTFLSNHSSSSQSVTLSSATGSLDAKPVRVYVDRHHLSHRSDSHCSPAFWRVPAATTTAVVTETPPVKQREKPPTP